VGHQRKGKEDKGRTGKRLFRGRDAERGSIILFVARPETFGDAKERKRRGRSRSV